MGFLPSGGTSTDPDVYYEPDVPSDVSDYVKRELLEVLTPTAYSPDTLAVDGEFFTICMQDWLVRHFFRRVATPELLRCRFADFAFKHWVEMSSQGILEEILRDAGGERRVVEEEETRQQAHAT